MIGSQITLPGQAIYNKNGMRPQFLATVAAAFAPNVNQHVCHSISYFHMETWLCEMLNGNNVSQNNLEALSQCICNANVLPVNVSAAITALVATAPGVPAVPGAPGAPNGPSLASVNAANHLLTLLNSAIANLRVGDATWNITTQSSFDPRKWIHCSATGAVDSNHLGNPAANIANPFPNPTFNTANKFFLVDQDDCAQLSKLNPIPAQTSLTIIRNASTVPGGISQFIYSSSNTFYVPPQALNPGHNVYYYNTVNHAWTLM